MSKSSKRSSEGFLPRNMELSNKMAFSHEIQQFHMIVRSGKCINTNFAFLEHFAWLCETFTWSCKMEIHNFSTHFCYFFHFFLSKAPQSPPNPCPNQLHYLFHYAFETSSTLFVLFNLIHFFCHHFIKIIPWNDFKTL